MDGVSSSGSKHAGRAGDQYFAGSDPDSGNVTDLYSQDSYGRADIDRVRTVDVAYADRVRAVGHRKYSCVLLAMRITFEISWLISVLLASIRVGTLFLFGPLVSVTRAPAQFRIFFVIALSVATLGAIQTATPDVPESVGSLLSMALNELIIGGALAFGLIASFAAFLLGGRILDFQMGFGVANLIDPATDTPTAMMGVILNLLAVAYFFAIDGHHLLIRGLAYSFEKVPLGGGLSNLNFGAIVAHFGAMFAFATALIAPVLFSILLLDIGLAVAARTMPQVNIFFVSFPLKIFVGLTVLAITERQLGPVMERLFTEMFRFWQRVLT